MKKAKKKNEDANNKRKLTDLEGVEEKRELAKKRSQRYQQRMTKAYAQAVGTKDGGTHKEEPPEALQIHPKMGRTLHHQDNP